MKYIINNLIVFSPGEGLYLAASQTVEFKLSFVADRILFLLVSSNGATIPRSEIHDYLWSECSVDATSASINNNISYLRRYFKELGLSDFIVTTAKVGVSIRQGILIEHVSQEKTPDDNECHTDTVGLASSEKSEKSEKNIKWLWSLFIGVILLCMSLFLFFRYSTSMSTDYIGSTGDCKVFSIEKLSDTETGKLMTSVKTFINENSVTCNENQVIIASSQDKGKKYLRGKREFFSVCEINKTHLYSCDSHYYLGGVG